MTLYYCRNCPLIRDDCGPWDDEHELFQSVFPIHKKHDGFQKGQPIIKKSIETEFQSAFNSMIGLMLHQLISHEKGFAKSCLISHKPWRETENWSY